MGILYTSLTFGLILIKQDSGVAWLGIHILLIVAALTLVNYNRFEVIKKW
jgi:thiosulfate dehydrogenase [quinone] large subunit